MLTPLESAQSSAIVSTMQSVIRTIEDRQREEAEKASGRKDDEARKAHIRSDESARQANARINEHFFGSNARSEDTLAKLIARFTDTLGVSRRPDETSRAFAQRLADMVALIDGSNRTDGQGNALTITLKSIGTTLEAVKTAMSGGKTDDAGANLVARLAFTSGVTQGAEEVDADFEDRLTSMLTHLRGELPASKETLEKQTGLAALGFSAEDIIAAIRNPYGSEAQRMKDALAEKAQAEKALTPEMRKVLARLEDAANPKSIEELKLERVRRDPTRVEDAETRAEREETIKALEAGEKLEEARKLQDAVARANEAAAKGETTGEVDDPVSKALTTIQLLAAGAAAPDMEEKETSETGEAAGDAPAETTEEALRNLTEAEAREEKEREEARKDVFVLRVDDNGIYDLITRQLTA